MGQTCKCIVYGVDLGAAIEDGVNDEQGEALYYVCRDFGLPARWQHSGIVGIEIAVGGSGRRGAADLENVGPLPMGPPVLADHDVIGPKLRAAESAWGDFVHSVFQRTGIDLSEAGKPCLWLDDTETS